MPHPLAPLLRRLAPVAVLAAVLFGALLTAPMRAEAQSVIVLGVRSLEGDDEFTRNLTGALRHAASQVAGWTVNDRDVTLAQMALAHGCDDPGPSCMTQIAESLAVQRVLYGDVRRTSAGDPYDFSINLHLFNAQSGNIEVSIAETLPGARRDIDDLREPVRRYVARLSGAPRVGSIAVTVNVPGAEVFVDDVSAGSADSNGRLVINDVAAGTRRVRVVALGHNSFRSTLSVEAYGESTFEAELQVGAGEGGGGGVPVELVVGVGLLAIAAASVGLWIWSMVEIDAINSDDHYQMWRDEDTAVGLDVCTYHVERFREMTPPQNPNDPRLAELCDRGRTFEVLQFVFLGLAAVSGGLGAYFLATGATSGGGGNAEAATWRLTPNASATGGGLSLSGTF